MTQVISEIHHDFDRARPPVARIESGDVVTFECPGPPMPEHCSPEDVLKVDASHPHPLAGPVEIAGAEPGDAIVVDILDLELPQPWGHCLFIPGRGLLPDDFEEVYVENLAFDDGFARIGDAARVRLEPFCGILGLAPAAVGPHSTIPPRRVGGNLDIRDLTVGAQLVLPVEVPGALFSCGDGHAAQGDGEVCVTAIETAIRPTLRLTLRKDAGVDSPTFTTAPERKDRGGLGWFGTCGMGEDLYEASRDAVKSMIGHLVAERGLTRQQAYVLCSLVVDLHISQIVNAPNYIVTAQVPLEVFA